MRIVVRLAAHSALVLGLLACGGGGDGGTGGGGSQQLRLEANSNTTLTGTAGTAIGTAPSVKVVDASTGAPKSGVTVTFAVASGGGAVTGATQTTNASGVATVASWTLGGTAGANTLTASASVNTGSPVTFTATGSAGAAAKLAFATQPAANVTAGAAMAPVAVRITDAFGNLVATATNAVTIALGANPGASTLGGTATVAAVGGVATFNDLTLNKASANYSLVASAAGLTGATSTLLTVNAGAAAKLAFFTQPASVGAGVSLGNVAVELRDANDNRATSATNAITIAIGSNPGGSTLGGTATVAAVAGLATFANLTLNNPGTGYTLSASGAALTGATSAAFNIASAPVATTFAKSAGDNQTAPSGTNVTTKPQVRVTDQFGNGVAGRAVTFAVASGNGYATSVATTTDANGFATVGNWMLGRTGANTLTASTSGFTAVTFSATASAVASAFAIEVRYVGTAPSAAIQAAFANAAARWSQAIIGDIIDVDATGAPAITTGACAGHPALNGIIDDLVIFAEMTAIDGAGGTLGVAAPCYYRATHSTLAPITGYMKFDTADLANMEANGTLNDVILHEMGHVLGIGTMWSLTSQSGGPSRSLLVGGGAAGASFSGASGATGFTMNAGPAVFGGTPVPVEDCVAGVPAGCGAGTRDSHWREVVFRNELMTGYISGTNNPLSFTTIGSLADIGYTVNFGAADVYTAPPPTAVFSGAAARRYKLEEMRVTGPLYGMDARGRITNVIIRK